MRGSLCASALAFLIVFAGSPGDALGAVVFDLGVEYSDGNEPAGTPPWLRATFADAGAGTVTLTLEALNLTGDEFVMEWRFNLKAGLDPDGLSFSTPVKTGAFSGPLVSTGADFTQAPGDGKFDVLFAFSNDNNEGDAERFGAGDAAVYTISAAGLTEDSFNALSTPVGNTPPLLTAAKVQGIGPGAKGSGNVTVPEPGGAALVLAAALAGGFVRPRPRRRRR